MIPDPIRILAAPHTKRDPDTDEVSWPPPSMELELMELGLIPRKEEFKHGKGRRTTFRTGLRD